MPLVPVAPPADALPQPVFVDTSGAPQDSTSAPPSRSRRRSRRRTGGRDVTSPPAARRHVYVTKDGMRDALCGWGMTLDESSLVPFLSRFVSDSDNSLIDYSDFALVIAEILKPGAYV